MKGDPVRTRTFTEIVNKEDPRIEAVGCIDEANAFIGLAKVKSTGKTREILSEIQRKMFKAGSEVAGGRLKITQEDLNEMMNAIRELENGVEFPKRFIILEKDELTSLLSVARSVVRRAERKVVSLYNRGFVSLTLVEWLNKLSYLIYLLILKELNGQFEEI